ncbi:MAG: hypothetical protein ACRD3O_21795, partial [Terriglobia bacterium]
TYLARQACPAPAEHLFCARAENARGGQKRRHPRQSRPPRQLECYVRYHAAQDRAYQRASTELQKRKKARQLAEIGFASQKRHEAEESRKAEKHAVQIATANLRKQREELKLATALAQILPPDQAFSAAITHPGNGGLQLIANS